MRNHCFSNITLGGYDLKFIQGWKLGDSLAKIWKFDYGIVDILEIAMYMRRGGALLRKRSKLIKKKA